MKAIKMFFLILISLVHLAFSQDDAYERMRKNRTAKDWVRVYEIFEQVDQIIYYSPLLLGKSEYQLYSNGRPSKLSEDLFPWNSKWLEPPSGEKKLYVTLKHGTTISVTLSTNTFKSYLIRFFPNWWVSTDEFHDHIKSKYGIREDGFSKPIATFDKQTAVFKFTIEDNTPTIYILNIAPDGTFLYN
jgi:hypothetical protein